MSQKPKKKSNGRNRNGIDIIDDYKPMIDDLTDEVKSKPKFKFKAKNHKQQRAWDSLHENLVNFLIGKVGSGKTYIAVAYAVKMLQEKKVKKIVLLRPATVNSLEQIGYLKGTLEEKVSPLILPMKSIFEELLGKITLEQYMERGIIQPYSIAYVEGMTYKNSIVLVDEYQNTSSEMLRAILTRIDDTSQCIVMGDENQIKLDNPMISASKDVVRFKDKKGIGFIEFEDHEIVRGEITKLIESCYEDKPKVKFNLVEKEQEKFKQDAEALTWKDIKFVGVHDKEYINWEKTNDYDGDIIIKSKESQLNPTELKDVLPKEEYSKRKDIPIYGYESKIIFPNTSYNSEEGV